MRVGHSSPRVMMLMLKADCLFRTFSFEWLSVPRWFVNDAQQGFSKWYLHVREMVNKRDAIWCQSVQKTIE